MTTNNKAGFTTTPATAAKGVNKEAVNSLTMQLARQTTGYHFSIPTQEVLNEKPTNIVVAKNGVFRVIDTPVARFSIQIAKGIELSKTEVATIPGLAEITPGVELKIPKIPWKYWLQFLSFYRDVYTKDRTEASALFFWNHDEIELPPDYAPDAKGVAKPIKGILEDGQLIIYCPQQKNSGGLSEFHADGMVDWLRENCTPLCETHSHHSMDAYFSPTDDANENMNQFYGVFGKIMDREPKFAFRFCSGSFKIQIPMDILFDRPIARTVTHIDLGGDIVEYEEEKVHNGPWPKVDYPEDWMPQHSVTWRAVGNARQWDNKGSVPPQGGGATPYQSSHYDYEDEWGGAWGWGDGGHWGRQGNSTDPKSRAADASTRPWAERSAEERATYLASLDDDSQSDLEKMNEKKNGAVTQNGLKAQKKVEAGNSEIKVTCDEVNAQIYVEEAAYLLEELCRAGIDLQIADALSAYTDVHYE